MALESAKITALYCRVTYIWRSPKNTANKQVSYRTAPFGAVSFIRLITSLKSC
jgi:hypothetical protein